MSGVLDYPANVIATCSSPNRLSWDGHEWLIPALLLELADLPEE
jgi:hypothetical protein